MKKKKNQKRLSSLLLHSWSLLKSLESATELFTVDRGVLKTFSTKGRKTVSFSCLKKNYNYKTAINCLKKDGLMLFRWSWNLKKARRFLNFFFVEGSLREDTHEKKVFGLNLNGQITLKRILTIFFLSNFLAKKPDL